MRFLATVAVLATASFAAAQTSTSTACAAQNIVDACLATTSVQKDSCAPNDWKCLCDAWTTILTCYNNCPGSPDRFGASQTQVSYCNAAAAYASTSTSASTAYASIASGSSTGSVVATSTATKTASGSSTASAKATGNAAAGVMIPAVGGLAAILAGVAGFL